VDTELDAPQRRAASDWLLFVVPSFIWGTTWFAITFQLGTVPPEVSVVWRFGAASLILFGWCLLRRIPLRFDLRTHLAYAALGLLQYAINYVLVYLSEGQLTSGLVALLFGLLVIWNIAGARVFFGTAVTPAIALGAGLGILGVTLVLWPELSHVRSVSGHVVAVALATLATLTSSAGNLYSQRIFRRGLPVIPSTAFSMLYGSLAVALYCVLRGIPFSFDLSFPYLASLGYLALFGSVFAFISYLTLLRRIGAGRAGYTAVVIPVVAMANSTVFEGYRWTAPALGGMLLVLTGNVLVLRRRS
jgi:drug/metabolite transporter (DMT)-like permease